MTHPDLILLLLADARLPVGGHTQSGTLEGALGQGLGAADVPSYLRTRLLSSTRVEAGTAVVARASVVRRGSLVPVERAWAARTVSPALREASRVQGHALLRLARRTWPDVARPLDEVPRPSRACVLGALAAGLGLGPGSLARLVAYDDVQTVCAAALKLLPLDPVTVAGWVAEALPGIADLETAVSWAELPSDIPACSAPQIETWAQVHAASTRRLFRA
ncbi:urease accessory protein UreF [Nocardioides nitrophenolicus]|uniref:urease accessory protein UreF n=1 Tax=Nocardioides nitrophenolicus TaxID=60489 RepID=UPI001961C878|nr:urease accessory UreF family protein [Nocardioides nitrophenolicus]MBM7520410.1 urease accessory protein [Nocardioides nitrophenolicus]